MVDVFKVCESMISHIKSQYPNDVAIAAYYGSYAQGTATKRSDLDFFYIPASEAGRQVSLQFIVGDISFDLWPISWERAQRMAQFDEMPTIIADCKLLYVRSDEDLQRFMELRKTVTTMQAPENRIKLIEKAESCLCSACMHLYKLRRDGKSRLTVLRTEAQGVLTHTLQGLAVLNGTYFTKGFGKNKEQIMNLTLRPNQLETLMNKIMRSVTYTDTVEACERLMSDTLEIVEAQKELCVKEPSYGERMYGFYEEEKGILDKILTACERNDYDTAFFFSIHAQQEISHFLYFAERGQWPSELESSWVSQDIYRRIGFPNLVEWLDPDELSPLQTAVEQLNFQLEAYLLDKGVRINRFGTLEQFKTFLSTRG